MSDESDEVVKCYQCDWPLLRGEGYTVVVGECEGCGNVHPIAIVHLQVCAASMARGETRQQTQRLRAGATGMN